MTGYVYVCVQTAKALNPKLRLFYGSVVQTPPGQSCRYFQFEDSSRSNRYNTEKQRDRDKREELHFGISIPRLIKLHNMRNLLLHNIRRIQRCSLTQALLTNCSTAIEGALCIYPTITQTHSHIPTNLILQKASRILHKVCTNKATMHEGATISHQTVLSCY